MHIFGFSPSLSLLCYRRCHIDAPALGPRAFAASLAAKPSINRVLVMRKLLSSSRREDGQKPRWLPLSVRRHCEILIGLICCFSGVGFPDWRAFRSVLGIICAYVYSVGLTSSSADWLDTISVEYPNMCMAAVEVLVPAVGVRCQLAELGSCYNKV